MEENNYKGSAGSEDPKGKAPEVASDMLKDQKLSLPKGGGAIKGMGQSFAADAFSGTGSFSVPIELPACRNLNPSPTLSYHSAGGNGPWGMGFSISLGAIARKRSKKVPTYDDQDVFTLSGAGDLVHLKEASQIRRENNREYQVRTFRPEREGLFALLEYCIDPKNQESHWRIQGKDGSVSLYGMSKAGRVYDPANPSRIAEWLLEETTNIYGDKISYHYRCALLEDTLGGARAIERIAYGFFQEGEEEKAHFEVIFDYGENDFEKPIGKAYSKTPLVGMARKDAFSAHSAGFLERTEVLCRAIRVYHRFKELGPEPILVRGTYLDYDENPTITYLRALKEVGYSEYKGKPLEKQKPALVFSYSSADPSYLGSFRQVHLKAGQPLPFWLAQLLSAYGYKLSNTAQVIQEDQSHWLIQEGAQRFDLKKEGAYWNLYDASYYGVFKPLQIKGFNELPGYIDGTSWQWVDLYQEGIEGLLYKQGDTFLYYRPQGEGSWAKSELLKTFPSNKGGSLVSLEADGNLDFLVQEDHLSGYHSFDAKKNRWSSFEPLESRPTDLGAFLQDFVDVSGDGRLDVLAFEGDTLKVYPSKGKKGYGKASYKKLPKGYPSSRGASDEVFVGFADVFGDGKAHMLRIENGKVECWPNLGYGSFGAKVTLKNAPFFQGGLNTQRLYLSDIDGSGTTDLIYAYSDHLEIFFNESGNGFSKPVSLKLPASYDSFSQISFADVLGNGTSCLLLSYVDRGKIKHLYYDFFKGKKPHLLEVIDDNQGGISCIHYASSTEFYLKDRKEGNPWVTSLPFPVQVVEKLRTIDAISSGHLVSSYVYHHGFYDIHEREFRGFGFVERLDAEEFSSLEKKEEHYIAPVHSKSWFHTGVFEKAQELLEAYKEEFYQGDASAHPMSYHRFDEKIQNIKDQRGAYKALSGQLLREEVYGRDGDPAAEHPYSVVETGAYVRLLQGGSKAHPGVFLSYTEETLNHHYERDPKDPRIEQSFTLEVDLFGYTTQSAALAYARREAASYPEQRKLYLSLLKNEYIHHREDFYLLGTPCQNQSFEIGGFALAQGVYASLEQVQSHAQQALKNPLAFEEDLSLDQPAARLLSHGRQYYWSEDQTEALPLGQVGPIGLLHHSEQMAFSENHIREIFKEKIFYGGKDLLEVLEALKYKKEGEAFWVPGSRAYYFGSEKYYLPAKSITLSGAQEESIYDDYALLPIGSRIKESESSDIEYTTTLINDYAHLSLIKLIDVNENTSEVLLDPLGLVVASSIYGSESGQNKGDHSLSEYVFKEGNLEQILAKPQDYLQGATSFFYYDLQAWGREGKPSYALSLQREVHASDLPQGVSSPVRMSVSYSDGFGRALQTKALAGDQEWLSSGRVVYNNKGSVVKQYEPFYSNTPLYDPVEAKVKQGVCFTFYYDPLMRKIQTKDPKGYISKVAFTPWKVVSFDSNDTIKDAPYYKAFMEQWEQASEEEKKALANEKDALDKALAHYNTPSTSHLDPLGRDFLQVELLKEKEEDTPQELLTYSALDILGNERSSADPRLYKNGKKNFVYTHTMAGLLKTLSCDAGETSVLPDAMGRPVYHWDARGVRTYRQYDPLGRVIKVMVYSEAFSLKDQIRERLFYATDPKEKATNRYGGLMAHYDQGGLLLLEENSFKGEVLKSTRTLRKSYDKGAHWEGVEQIDPRHTDLQEETFSTGVKYQATGELIEQRDPKGNKQFSSYDPLGRLKTLKLQKSDQTSQKDYINDITYNPKGQRLKISYGNGVNTTYSYDKETFRLTSLKSNKGEKVFQDMAYFYDGVGNITRIKDVSYKGIFQNSSSTVSDLSDYRYDSLYRLIEATGREHPALYGKQPHKIPQGQIPSLNDQGAIVNYSEGYTYDTAGNIQEIRHRGAKNSTRGFTIDENSNRSFPMASCYQDIESSYDAAGNLILSEGLSKMHWNERSELSQVNIIERRSGKNDGEYYTYDSSRQRLRKVTKTYGNDGATFSLIEKIYLGALEITRTYQGDHLQKERISLRVSDSEDTAALHQYWTLGPEARSEGQDRYQLANHLHSVSLELNAAAELLSYEEYMPFGGTALMAGASAREVSEKEYRYSGKELDASTGFYYYGARYYAPHLARWINPDPAGTVDGLNLYQFVSGNPISFWDSRGYMKVGNFKKGKNNNSKRTPSIDLTKSSDKNEQHNNEINILNNYDAVRVRTRRGSINKEPEKLKELQKVVTDPTKAGMQANMILYNVSDGKMPEVAAAGSYKSGAYVQGRDNQSYRFPSGKDKGEKFKEGIEKIKNDIPEETYNEIVANQNIDQAVQRGGKYQMDAEAAGMKFFRGTGAFEGTGKNQVLFMAIGASSCNNCSNALANLALDYPDLKFSFEFGREYKAVQEEMPQNIGFPIIIENFKDRILEPVRNDQGLITSFKPYENLTMDNLVRTQRERNKAPAG